MFYDFDCNYVNKPCFSRNPCGCIGTEPLFSSCPPRYGCGCCPPRNPLPPYANNCFNNYLSPWNNFDCFNNFPKLSMPIFPQQNCCAPNNFSNSCFPQNLLWFTGGYLVGKNRCLF